MLQSPLIPNSQILRAVQSPLIPNSQILHAVQSPLIPNSQILHAVQSPQLPLSNESTERSHNHSNSLDSFLLYDNHTTSQREYPLHS